MVLTIDEGMGVYFLVGVMWMLVDCLVTWQIPKYLSTYIFTIILWPYDIIRTMVMIVKVVRRAYGKRK